MLHTISKREMKLRSGSGLTKYVKRSSMASHRSYAFRLLTQQCSMSFVQLLPRLIQLVAIW